MMFFRTMVLSLALASTSQLAMGFRRLTLRAAAPGAGGRDKLTPRKVAQEPLIQELAEQSADSPYIRSHYKYVKQVTSLGPKTFGKDMIKKLFEAGADVFRLNLSHGREEKGEITEIIREVQEEYNYPIGVLADLQGPKQRCGMFKDDAKFELAVGDKFRFDLDDEEGDSRRVKLPHPEILEALEPGKTLLIDDGKIVMRVVEAGADWIECEVTVPGTISSRKGVNTPDVVLPISAMTPKDELDLNFILDYNPDYVALSFVQLPEDMELLRSKIMEHPCEHKPKIIAKLEKPCAIENLAGIVKASDAIMVARGDLGVEMDIEDVPMVQKHIIEECRKQGKPVIVATQMLESMMEAPSPTRAECSDVANAIFDGADAVMLSGESAAGKFPEESVSMQRRIISRTEEDPTFHQFKRLYALEEDGSDADAVVCAAKSLASSVDAKALVVLTTSGTTAERLARHRPDTPILAMTPSPEVAGSLTLVNGVYPSVYKGAWDGSTTRFSMLVREACRIAMERGIAIKDDDKLVVTGGLPLGVKGVANVIRVVQAAGPDCWSEDECQFSD
mmetsp:Transcript_14898/g.44914  ORF Transcript_14898/g.44914 Transcript_14898/m.44914 type:complete len:562 (-) Transcript_14898:732-2417(-)